jgi:hypothetical protein
MAVLTYFQLPRHDPWCCGEQFYSLTVRLSRLHLSVRSLEMLNMLRLGELVALAEIISIAIACSLYDLSEASNFMAQLVNRS